MLAGKIGGRQQQMKQRGGMIAWIFALGAALACLMPSAASAAGKYQAINITPTPGWEGDQATGINPSNQVSFGADTGGDYFYGFFYDPLTNTWVDLLRTFPFFEPFVTADAINGTGQIAGEYSQYGYQQQAFRWEPSTRSFTLLPTLSGADPQVAVGAINGTGQVIGTEQPNGLTASASRGFIWDGSATHLIPTLGGTSSRATDGYQAGQAVGCAQTSSGAWIPIRYQGGMITRIGNPTGFSTGCADATNQSGMIAGESTTTGGACESWRWKSGAFPKLPTLGGQCVSVEHLSNPGEIVGEAGSSAVVIDGTSISNLNNDLPFNSGLSINQAGASNLHGWIAASGQQTNSALVSLLLAPVTPVDDAALAYQGTWAHLPTAGAYKNSISLIDGDGSATFNFTGRFISVIGECSAGRGEASASIDGGAAVTLDESNCGTALRVPLWWRMFPGAGKHTLVISHSGSTQGEFSLDAVSYSAK
jgi:hypothetical protein